MDPMGKGFFLNDTMRYCKLTKLYDVIVFLPCDSGDSFAVGGISLYGSDFHIPYGIPSCFFSGMMPPSTGCQSAPKIRQS